MNLRVLDTNIVSYILKRHSLAKVYQPHLAGCRHAVSFQTVAELYEGGVLAGWGPKRWNDLEALLGTMTVLQSDDTVCEWWAEIRVVRRSQPMPVADCWIAATAVANKLELVTHNPADFAGIPWLTVISEAP